MSRLLLLLDHGENRRLFERLIGDRHSFVRDLGAPCDLCIADPRSLEEHHAQLQGFKDAAAPLFWPLLFIASPNQKGRIPARVWELADDVIVPPVERLELFTRLEKLLHTRQLSLEIEANRNKLQKNFNELDQLRATLERQNGDLKKLNEQKNQLMGTAAHDLRTPLGVITAYSDFLLAQQGKMLGPQERDFVDKIRSSSAFMRDLVDDLLDVSRLAVGELALHPVSTDLAVLVERNADLNRLLAQQKGIALNCHVEAVPHLQVDNRKIEQVLNNLISNAIKFSAPDTTIEVTVERAEQVIIAVKDEGQGIPADELHAIFDPFHQTSVQSTAGEKGTGLGLAIVRRIVEAHGGHVRVESTVGQGSTFYVVLPVDKTSAPVLLAPKQEQTAQGPVYDRAAALERFGDAAALDKALADFMQECPSLFERARWTLGRDEPRALLRVAAKLSWHLGLLCAPQALETALALESVGRYKPLTEAAPLLDRLEQEIRQLEQAFKS